MEQTTASNGLAGDVIHTSDLRAHQSILAASTARVNEHSGNRSDRSLSPGLQTLGRDSELLSAPQSRLAAAEQATPKILYVIGQLQRGGAEQQLYYLLKHLRPSAQVVSLSQTGYWAEPIRALGINVIELPRAGRVDFARLRALTKIVREYKPDIIHIFLDNVPGLYGRLAALLAGHFRVVAGERAEAALQQPFWYRMLKRVMNKGVAAVVSNSQANYEYLLKGRIAPSRKLLCIPNGLELDLFTSKSPANSRAESEWNGDRSLVVGMVGSLSPVKSPDVFIRSAARVLEQHKNVTFVHVGDGTLRTRMETLACDLGILDHFSFAGYCQDVPLQLARMDVFVLTSSTEGLPNAVMEAMAAGLPCVVTDAGGCREVVSDGETGFVVPIGDEERLAERIGILLRDMELRRGMGLKGQVAMRQFGVRRMAAGYGKLYDQILKERVI